MNPPPDPALAPGTPHDARMRLVLDAAPELYRPQPVDSLAERLLDLSTVLCGAEAGLVALLADHDLVTRRVAVEGIADLEEQVLQQETPLLVRAVRRGAAAPGATLSAVPAGFRQPALHAVFRNEPRREGEGCAVPVRLGRRAVGAVVVDRCTAAAVPALEEAAYHASQALQNLVLFAAGTGIMPVGYDHAVRLRLEQSLRSDLRRGDPCAVVCAAIVDLERIRRGQGRRVAEAAVFHLGRFLRRVARETDTVGRSGPGEFMVVLPSTSAQGAAVFAGRLGADVHRLTVEAPETTYRVDVGIAALPPYDASRGPVPRELFESLTGAFLAAGRRAVEVGRATGSGIPIIECSWGTLIDAAAGPPR